MVREPAMCLFWVSFDPPVKAKMCFPLRRRANFAKIAFRRPGAL